MGLMDLKGGDMGGGGNMILPQMMNGGNLDGSIIDADNSLINNSMIE